MTSITLHGFNNLTKNLSFSLYKLHYITKEQSESDYIAYINQHFSAEHLNAMLAKISYVIGGTILNVAQQNYHPQGASVTLMISEEAKPESLIAHLDKSHLCIHTYPDDAPQNNIAIFRADIELSTCGVISPLKVLNYVIEEFNADIIDIDYRIRGMTRNKNGEKLYTDSKLNNINGFFNGNLKHNFDIKNYSLPIENLFHSKLRKKIVNIENYLTSKPTKTMSASLQQEIKMKIGHELEQLFKLSN